MTKRIEKFGPVRRFTGPYVRRTSPKRLFFTLCLCACAPLCLVLFPLFPASGYVLPGQHLLLLMTKSLGSASGLGVHQKTLVYDGTEPGPRTELSETLTYRFSDAFRCETVSPGMTRIHVDNLDDAVTILDDYVTLQDESRFDRYKDLLLFHSRILLQERLSRRGIDTMVTSLGRFDGVPVYVLGAQYPDMTTAQIWMDKETFWPLRLLIPMTDSEGGVSILEFRYLLWQKDKKLWYPMKIECYENQQLIREMVVQDMSIDPSIVDDDFDVSLLRARYRERIQVQEGAQEPVQSDIQKALDEFRKRYE